MIDYVAARCSECKKVFHTWLSRGEIAPALCLPCWWKAPRPTKPPAAEGTPAGRPGQILDPAVECEEPLDLEGPCTSQNRDLPGGRI
jgi:hypothetical protein